MSKNKERRRNMKEDDNILRKAGAGNSFKVPEGYFDNLTSEVMNKLPEREKATFETHKVTLWDKVKPWAYMAAMFIGAALIIRVATANRQADTDSVIASEVTDTTNVSDQYINTALDASMMDDYSLYVYLSDAGDE
ncbi:MULTISPECIES: hypothetical protein [Bacteroides]|uniref:hypothetical protein n=1 Tax=Bacteroides TaxID=816 RepID=UPI0005AA3CAA|nr:hypothetical protein [Bacteroides neonati]